MVLYIRNQQTRASTNARVPAVLVMIRRLLTTSTVPCLYVCVLTILVQSALCLESKASLQVQLQLTIPNSPVYVVDTTVRQALAAQIATHANTACGPTCSILAGDVLIDTWDVTQAPVHAVGVRIMVRDMAEALMILPNSATVSSQNDIRWLLSTTHSGGALGDSTMSVVVSALATNTDSSRPVQCGDSVLGGSEQCDDGNVAIGDGCDAVCQFETGFMCHHHWRDPLTPQTPGQYLSAFSNGSFALSSAVEACSGYDAMCVAGALWRPENWVAKYEPGVVLPPRGFYCGSFCTSFPAPAGYVFDQHCGLLDINECMTGAAVCDYNAYCKNELPENSPGARGYSCRCDSTFFATAIEGLGCAAAGVEIVLVVAGQKMFDANEEPPPDRAVMEALRLSFFDTIIAAGYTSSAVNAQILAEAVLDYPVELIGVSVEPEFSGRALWELRVRVSSLHTNYATMSDATLFRNFTRMASAFSDLDSPDNAAHKLHTIARCSNDYSRTCTADTDCLALQACLYDVPDVLWAAVEGSHASSSVKVASSGFSLISVDYDSAQSAWKARVRYDNSVPGVMDVLYVPHVSAPVSASERATFRPDEFPCLPVGTGEFQQRREDSLCCLYTVDSAYTTVVNFGTYLGDTGQALGAAVDAQGSCVTYDSPPVNTSKLLLDTSVDFVAGPFARTTRSHSSLDTVVTSGYQDLLLYLAEEDMRNMGGIETTIDGGYNLRFFIGMAHIKALDSTRIHTSFSHVEITADVSQAYVFTSSAATDFTFIRDVNVDLVQVKDQGGGPALKFARVQLTVPLDVSADEATGVIPVTSARVSVGYSPSTAAVPVYPCVVSTHECAHHIPSRILSCFFGMRTYSPLIHTDKFYFLPLTGHV